MSARGWKQVQDVGNGCGASRMPEKSCRQVEAVENA